MTRLAVLGSPIAHSLSPVLHRAAFGVLGLDWSYEAIEAVGADLPRLFDDEFHGLSLTMPLKRDVLPLLDDVDETAILTGAVNTVLFDDGRRGFNTDVAGIVRAFARSNIDSVDSVHVLGSGATAASVIAAVQSLGAESVTVFARTPANADPLVQLGEALGLPVLVRALDESTAAIAPDLIANTLPGTAEHGLSFPEAVRGESVLFEVAYSPWPSALAQDWFAVGGTVVDGLDMLIEQALVQERIFVGGSPTVALPDEERVLAAMRAAVSR
jgi:shikimate dehydrogenase